MLSYTKNDSTIAIVLHIADFEAQRTTEVKELLEAIDFEGVTRVEIDFSEVEFIDSSGIGVLVSVQKKLKEQPNTEPLVIVNASPSVLSVFELLQLHRLFTIEQN